MACKETIKKPIIKMLTLKDKFSQFLGVYFSNRNSRKMSKHTSTIKNKKNYNHILQSIILRWMNNYEG